MRAIMVQGTSSGAGKTTLAAALCRILSDRGLSVAPFKAQNMSRSLYRGRGFAMSAAQAVQAAAARAEPSPDMNPVALVPLGEDLSRVYVMGRPLAEVRAAEYYARLANRVCMPAALAALRRLGRSHDAVVIEGAGSPAEVNLRRHDIANMRIAAAARCPVVVVADVDRGGALAALVGTMALLEPRHRRLVRGFVLNKFRGDPAVLRPGLRRVSRETGRPVYGVIPHMRTGLPEEDSLGGGPRRPARGAWGPEGRRRTERAISRLARAVSASVDARALEAMVR